MQSSAKLIEFPDMANLDYFGVCPKCFRNDGYLNDGPDHWYHCRRHKLKWWIGSNMFSGWQLEDESTRRASAELLAGYTEVEEFNPLDQTAVATGDVPC